MTQMMNMPRVQTCTVPECGYNHDGCTAFAITIGSLTTAEYDTFINSREPVCKGVATAQDGVCKRPDRTYKEKLECSAHAITVGASADKADCLTYQRG